MARRRNNPLALAALVTLFDEDRHPYDIAQTLKCRRHDQSMRLNFGSLYSVMKTLERNDSRSTSTASTYSFRSRVFMTERGGALADRRDES